MKRGYFLVLFICFFLSVLCCNAEIQTFDRNTLNNYGVNKKWKITNDNKDNILNTYAVSSDLKVYDFADILSDLEEKSIYDLSLKFYNKTGMELIFLSDNFYNTTDYENEEFATDFYDYNDFGLNDEHYSGVIIFRNSYESYPYYSIYTFGEAQYYFSNSRIDRILDSVYDDMISKNYLTGFTYIIDELNYYYSVGKDNKLKDYYIDENGFLIEKYSIPIFPVVIISSVITFIVIFVLVKKNKMIYKATLAREYLDNNSIKYAMERDQFITSRTTSHTISSSSGGRSSSGGGSRSGSSGGGHGGGGRRG